MKKFLFLSSLLFSTVFIGAGCTDKNGENQQPVTGEKTNITVVTSFYPLTFLSERIIGDTGTIIQLAPTGVDAHDFEPSPRDIGTILESDLFLYQGNQFDTWAQEASKEAQNQGVSTIAVSEQLDLLPFEEEEHEQEGEEHEGEEHEDEHNHGNVDPHTWLDPIMAIEMAEIVKNELIAVNPSEKETYEKNTQALIAELTQLDTDFQTALQNCSKDTIVTAHDAFGYIGARYHFEIIPIAGISPEEEPSAKQLTEMTDLVKEKNITTIFTETLVSEKIAQTIAKETGAQIRMLHPLEGLTAEQITQGSTYLTEMRNNAQALRLGLECQ